MVLYRPFPSLEIIVWQQPKFKHKYSAGVERKFGRNENKGALR